MNRVRAVLMCAVIGLAWAALSPEAATAERNCQPAEMIYRVSATDGGMKGIMVDAGSSGVSYQGGTQLAGDRISSFCGDGITIKNNSAIPLRCRGKGTDPGTAGLGFTVCNHTGCDYSNSVMSGPYDPCKVICNIPAVNRDAGVFTFTGTVSRTCLP